jgi:NAD(P)H-nitrite reductase large subunit
MYKNQYDYIIIGASAAGIAAATKIRSCDKEGSIFCIDQQRVMPYNTCLLVDVLSQEKEVQEIALKKDIFFQEQNIDLGLGITVVSINKKEKTITTDSNQIFVYKKLLLATGTEARQLISGKGIFSFHQLTDVFVIQDYKSAHYVRLVLILGAGLSGVEAADAFIKKGYQVFIVEKAKRLLPEFLNEEASQFLQKKMEAAGVTLFLETELVTLEHENNQNVVYLNQGQIIVAQMVLVTIGSIQNSRIAALAGIAVDDKGIIVNQYLQTSDEYIFAAGDVIGFYDNVQKKKIRNGTWPEAVKQGMIAGHNMVQSKSQSYGAAPVLTSSRFFGLAFISGGLLQAETGDQIFEHRMQESYYRCIVSEGRLKGVIMIGQLKAVGYLRRALAGDIPFDIDLFLAS